jgi:hypothetical protein
MTFILGQKTVDLWYYFLPLLLLEKPGLEDVVLGNLP